jgi:hypothetical protein
MMMKLGGKLEATLCYCFLFCPLELSYGSYRLLVS